MHGRTYVCWLFLLFVFVLRCGLSFLRIKTYKALCVVVVCRSAVVCDTGRLGRAAAAAEGAAADMQ